MRAIDRLEGERMFGEPVTVDLIEGMVERAERKATATLGGEVAAIFALTRPTALSTTGIPWMLATTLADRPAFGAGLVRRAGPVTDWLFGSCARLENWIAAENRRSIRWLERLGFAVDHHNARVVRGLRFVPFGMERAHVWTGGAGGRDVRDHGGDLDRGDGGRRGDVLPAEPSQRGAG